MNELWGVCVSIRERDDWKMTLQYSKLQCAKLKQWRNRQREMECRIFNHNLNTPCLTLSGQLWAVYLEYFFIENFQGPIMYVWGSKVLANERSCYICSILFHWLRPCSAIARKHTYQDSKIHGANMGPTWFLSAPGGPHVGPMNLAIRVVSP